MDYMDSIQEPLPLPDLAALSLLSSPHCCLTISKQFIDLVFSNTVGNVILSIGSGSGLLEAIIEQNTNETTCLRVYGVEVSLAVNKYLRPDRLLIASGLNVTYIGKEAVLDFDTLTANEVSTNCKTWLVCYLRRPELLGAYLSRYGRSALQRVIVAGPLNEYPMEILSTWGSEIWKGQGSKAGVAEYETVGVWKRN